MNKKYIIGLGILMSLIVSTALVYAMAYKSPPTKTCTGGSTYCENHPRGSTIYTCTSGRTWDGGAACPSGTMCSQVGPGGTCKKV